MSDATTDGIRIRVRSQFIPERSDPASGQYFFSYRVTISNEGEAPAQLVSRHWIICDATGRTEHVKGPGVVGETPRLEPGQAFEYTSYCPLSTPVGSMRGTYQMVRDDKTTFDAVVGAFSLMTTPMLN